MNLGLGIETALTPAGGMDAASTAAGATAAGTNGKTNPAAAVFGQLMAKALQQQAKGQGQAGTGPAATEAGQGTADKEADAAALLAMLGATPESEPVDTDADDGVRRVPVLLAHASPALRRRLVHGL